MGTAADDEIRVTGLGSRSKLRLGVCVVAVPLSVWWIVEAAKPDNYVVGRWIAGIGGPILLLECVLLLVTVWRRLRPLELRGDVLRVADGLRVCSIPLSELTGVGLVFSYVRARNGQPAGWYLTLWDGAGKPHQVEECWLDAHWKLADYRAVTHPRESADDLARSDAGQMARRIYDKVWSVQGSDGPLATKQAQKMRDTTVWTRDPDVYAFWSPDGDMGDFTQPGPVS